MLKIQTIAYI